MLIIILMPSPSFSHHVHNLETALVSVPSMVLPSRQLSSSLWCHSNLHSVLVRGDKVRTVLSYVKGMWQHGSWILNIECWTATHAVLPFACYDTSYATHILINLPFVQLFLTHDMSGNNGTRLSIQAIWFDSGLDLDLAQSPYSMFRWSPSLMHFAIGSIFSSFPTSLLLIFWPRLLNNWQTWSWSQKTNWRHWSPHYLLWDWWQYVFLLFHRLRSDHRGLITGQNFEGQIYGKEIELFWPSWQSWRLQYSFWTTFLPSGWRLILFGNRSGILWRGCTSFNITYLSLAPFGLFFIVSLMSLLSCYAHFFRSNGGNFDGDCVLEGILRNRRFVKSTRSYIYTK